MIILGHGLNNGNDMANYNFLHIHQSDGVDFDDLTALHQDLNIGELMESDSGIHPGTFIDKKWNGAVLYNRDEGVYMDSTLVWGCWGPKQYDAVASHLTRGKIVFRYSPEFGPDVYYVITPNDVEKIELKF